MVGSIWGRALPGALASSLLAAGALGQADEQLIHTGARAPGTVSVFKQEGSWRLRFSGDELIEYRVPMRDAEVRRGAIKVYEASSDCWPIARGGVGWRNAQGADFAPPWLEPYTTLVGESSTADSVSLDYRDDFEGVHHRRHTYELTGKSLRVRVVDLDGNRSYTSNYCGLYQGLTAGTEWPTYITMQGGLQTPVTMFRNGSQHFFLAQMLDLLSSNAADWTLYSDRIVAGQTSYRYFHSTYNNYKRQSDGTICAPLDDTVNLTVSRRMADCLVTPTGGPSPYRQLLTGRTIAILPNTNWVDYGTLWTRLEQWGIDDLAGYFFTDWTSSAIDAPLNQNVGPDWFPARNAAAFTTMAQQGVAKGHLLGSYMAFSQLPPSAPLAVQDHTHLARSDTGAFKLDLFTGHPLINSTASEPHAVREAQLVKQNYGLNLAYLDIQTYASPSRGADGDHIDQTAGTRWSKTHGLAVKDQRRWMRRMGAILEGPMLGESSISTAGSNMEFLWAGVCDSVQRVINLGAGPHADDLPLGSLAAPTTAPVIPEYEWRVFSRLQANHGNGFGDRFFSRNDGPNFVNMTTGQPHYPMNEAMLDRYRLYEITYGKAGFFATNGPYNGIGNYLVDADYIKEHYLMNPLQTLYYQGEPQQILYRHQGVMRTFEQVMAATGDLGSFRDAQIELSFSNGLRLWVNHNPSSWTVSSGGTTWVIPEDGFLALVPGTPFQCFSAIPPTTGGARIDYCYWPGRWEFFDGRGVVNGYGGITTGGIRRLKLLNFVHNRSVWETSTGAIQTSQGTLPPVVAVEIEPASLVLLEGERAPLKVTARYANGAWRDVTTLIGWTSSNEAVASADRGAVLTARGSGTATIGATAFQGIAAAPVQVQVP